MINSYLFEGDKIVLRSPDIENDSKIEAGWTNLAEYQDLYLPGPARPLSAFQLVKIYQDEEKLSKEAIRLSVRLKSGDRLIGFVKIGFIDWGNRSVTINLAIGENKDRGIGYEDEIIRMTCKYVFDELNMERCGISVREYNFSLISSLEKCEFTREVIRREALHRYGRRWDMFQYGLLREEWVKIITPGNGR